MIGALRGKVIERNADRLIVDVSGVGYEVTVTAAVLQQLEGTEPEVRLVIFTDVKETSISLFGFVNGLEKEVFLLLKKVKGVGSKIALSVLSAIGAEGVLNSIGRNDISRFKTVSGIGGKTAERIIVELRENVQSFVQEISVPLEIEKLPAPLAGKFSRVEQDVILALEKLGFPGERARQVVGAAVRDFGDVPEAGNAGSGELLRRALANLTAA
jgi:Holliday junction DNA helicase RuvA